MFDIVTDNPEVLAKCKEVGITPLIIGKDVEFVSKPTKTSKALLTIAQTAKRDVLESNIDAITEIENGKKTDFMHHRNAGIDQVNARILAEHQRPYILNLQALKTAQNPAVVLGRMLQNVRIAYKMGIPVIFASFARSPDELPTLHDHTAFWRGLGVHQEIVKNAPKRFEELIEIAKKRASNTYVAEGVQRTN